MRRGILAVLGVAAAAVAAAVVAVLLASTAAHAVVHNISVTMDEAQALSTCNPNPAPAGGGGSGNVQYDTDTNMLSWNFMFSNLSGAVTAAHFHGPAHTGKDAGIQVNISDLTSPSMGTATITEAQEADLLAGRWYVNYHTAACSGGEIRGQVTAVVGGASELSGIGGASGVGAAFIAAVAVAALFGTGALGGTAWLVRSRVRK